ncbi:SEC-C metal-binding domain-containing protein [Lactococcus lactis]
MQPRLKVTLGFKDNITCGSGKKFKQCCLKRNFL